MTHEHEIRAQEAAHERGEIGCPDCGGTGRTTDQYDGSPMPCATCVADIEYDPTAQTEPLTIGQQIVAWWETSPPGVEPADLAEKIDAEIKRLSTTPSGAHHLSMDVLLSEAAKIGPLEEKIERLRKVNDLRGSALLKSDQYIFALEDRYERLREALRKIIQVGVDRGIYDTPQDIAKQALEGDKT